MTPKGITVADLQCLLSTFPSDMEICVAGYEGGYVPLQSAFVSQKTLNLDEHDSGVYGPHDDFRDNEWSRDAECYNQQQFLIIDRSEF